jgi:hypothetical protein
MRLEVSPIGLAITEVGEFVAQDIGKIDRAVAGPSAFHRSR